MAKVEAAKKAKPAEDGPKKESVLNKKVKLSPELSKFVGGATEMSRPDVTKATWAWIKLKGLQDAKDKRVINPDAALATIIGAEPVGMMKMTGLINKHFIK